jgi:hypothetical protein
MFARGGLVLFDEIMPKECEAVCEDEGHNEIGEVEVEENGPDELDRCQEHADEVNSAAGLVGVLAHVEGIKIIQIFILYI